MASFFNSSLISTSYLQLSRLFAQSVSSQCTEILCSSLSPSVQDLIINRPSALNALSLPMILTLAQKTREWNNSQTRLVWFSGAGKKAFCSGGDIKILAQLIQEGNLDFMDQYVREEYQMDYMLSNIKAFQVSELNGIVMGGGAGVSMNAKAKISTEKTVFAMPENRIGLHTDCTASYFLSRLPGNLGVFLALTGTRVNGEDLVRIGLADYFIPQEEVQEVKYKLTKKVNKRTTEEEIHDFLRKSSKRIEGKFQNLDLVNEMFEGDNFKAVFENLERNQRNPWCKKVLENLKEQCPMSLRASFESIKRGKYMDLAQCLKMEFRLTMK